jgi:RNA polymerase subunit RPABC4/transcription elongation factor Spt4
VYDRQLEEEALLRDISLRRACPQCQAVTEPDWLVCPHCRAELRRLCDGCGKPMDLNWVICPFCASAPTATKPAQQYAPVAAAPAPVAAPTTPEPAPVAAGDGWGAQG